MLLAGGWTSETNAACELAQEVYTIEVVELGNEIGRHDQLMTAYGGVCLLEFEKGGSYAVTRRSYKVDLSAHLTLYYTGACRRTAEVLRTNAISQQAAEKLIGLGRTTDTLLFGGDVQGYGELLAEQWELKKVCNPAATNERINSLYRTARDVGGAIGGRLVGAGGGGFFLLCTKDMPKLQATMRAVGYRELPFSIGNGASVCKL
jgi:D-glycero-alpha-D-manno-heptose-7-phosphate kinase